MQLELTQELYHQPNCDHPIFQEVIHAAETVYATPEEMEDEGYEACPNCFPDRA